MVRVLRRWAKFVGFGYLRDWGHNFVSRDVNVCV
jgi:hypothetical protein